MCEPRLDAGDGVEHQAGQGDHPSHQQEAAVIAAGLVEHRAFRVSMFSLTGLATNRLFMFTDYGRSDEGGHTLE